MRRLNLISSSTVMVALCSLLVGGCGGSPKSGDENAPQDPQSGGLEGAPATSDDPSEDPASGGGENGNGGNQDDPKKFTICHVPPGNPDNAHTITVSVSALKAHWRHGDSLGACDGDADGGSGGEPDAGSGEPDAGSGEPDAGSGEPDAGSGEPDAGSECAPSGSTCGGGVTCCSGLVCTTEGYCEPIMAEPESRLAVSPPRPSVDGEVVFLACLPDASRRAPRSSRTRRLHPGADFQRVRAREAKVARARHRGPCSSSPRPARTRFRAVASPLRAPSASSGSVQLPLSRYTRRVPANTPALRGRLKYHKVIALKGSGR
ncbi:hypothetical protein ACLESO_48460 [Pyxidicoccus sp. 3LG]